MSAELPSGIEAQVCRDIIRRQQTGIAKYGTTVAENPLSLRQWLQHSYEEKLDDLIYMKRAIAEIDGEGPERITCPFDLRRAKWVPDTPHQLTTVEEPQPQRIRFRQRIFRILLWGIKTAGCIALFVAYLLAVFWLCDVGG